MIPYLLWLTWQAGSPMFLSQALIKAGAKLSCNISIRASLTERRPANESLSSAVSQCKCFVTSSTSDWMPCAVISRHADALHRAATCSRIANLGRPNRVFKMSTACE
ncbi:hypothetical protein T08_2052 [Trichinella sp. T8]|nr:hypothetical protein T08_2052 [Trichinella sp. T8]